MMLEQAAFRTAPAAPENVVCAPNVRISMLTDRMVRFEWSADGKFEDRETLAVLNRDLGREVQNLPPRREAGHHD